MHDEGNLGSLAESDWLNLIDESPLLCMAGQPARLFEKRSLLERFIRIQEQALMSASH